MKEGFFQEKIMKEVLKASNLQEGWRDFSVDQLIACAAVDPARLAKVRYALKTNGERRLEDLSVQDVLDFLYGIDLIVKIGDSYVAFDVCSDPSLVSGKIAKGEDLLLLRSSIGAESFGVIYSGCDHSPSPKELTNLTAKLEKFAHDCLAGKAEKLSLVCRY